MRKYTACLIILLLAAVLPRPIWAQSSLTIPGSIPTLAPLGSPLNSISFPRSGISTPVPTRQPANKNGDKKPAGFSISAAIAPTIGRIFSYLSRLIGTMKLNDAAKTAVLRLLERAYLLVLSYNARIDPLIRQWLTDGLSRLPDGVRRFTSVFIPFLTMAGKVLLGVVLGIISLKIILHLLGNILSAVFRPKRRRRS